MSEPTTLTLADLTQLSHQERAAKVVQAFQSINDRLEVQGAVLLQLVEAVKGLAPKQEPVHTPVVKPTHELIKLPRGWFTMHKVPLPNPGGRVLGKLVTHVDFHIPTQEYWIQVQA